MKRVLPEAASVLLAAAKNRKHKDYKNSSRNESACCSDSADVATCEGAATRRVRADVSRRRRVCASVVDEGRERGRGVGQSAKANRRRSSVGRRVVRHIDVLKTSI